MKKTPCRTHIFSIAILALSLCFSMTATAEESASVAGGDTILGLFVPLGDVGGADLGYGLNGEYMVADSFGLTVTGVYAGYEEDLGLIKVTYSNIIALAGGAYHLFTTDSLDISIGAKVGYNIVSVEVEGGGAAAGASESEIAYGGSLNFRYFFTENLAAAVSGGYGVGYGSVGLDWKF